MYRSLMRIRILPFNLMRIRIPTSKYRHKTWKRVQNIPNILAGHLQIDSDSDPAYHIDTDADS